ncbi:MAG: SMI1/KNR4 family protein, partial [Bacteroidota bacterium]
DSSRVVEYEGIKCWKTIPSTITKNEIFRIEKFYNTKLPKSFHDFLQYKFYMDLEVGELSWRLFDLLPAGRLQSWIEVLERDYRELIDDGYLVFGESDQLCLCFNSNIVVADNDHEVGMVDLLERKYQKIADNFDHFIVQLQVWLSEWQNRNS